MKQKQFSFMGGSIWGNRGAEAMLVTSIGELRKIDPELEFNVFSVYPENDVQLIKDAKVRIFNGKPLQMALWHFPWALLAAFFRLFKIKIPLPKSLAHMRDSEALLDIGGITFSDGRTLQLLFNVFTIWPAMLMGVPVIKLSQATGPFKKTLNRKLATIFFSKSEKVFSRGYISSEFLKTLHLPKEKVIDAADIAFRYEPDYALSDENEDRVSLLEEKLMNVQRDGSKVVAIVPSSLVLKQSRKLGINYSAKLLNMVLSTIDDHVHYVFLPNGTRASSDKVMNNDIIAIRAIRDYFAEELPKDVFDGIDWVDFDLNTRSVRKLINASDACVSSRFHAMIAGLALCVPTMVIGWSHKYQETLTDFRMQDYAVDYKSTELKILKVYQSFLANNKLIAQTLTEHIADVKQSSGRQFEYLKDRFF